MKKLLLSIFCLLGFVAANAGTADLETMNTDKNTSYQTRTSTEGWVAVNSAIFTTTDHSFIDGTAVCLNGKTSAVGKLTSPTLTGGIGTLTLNYGLPFSDTKFNCTVNILQNGAVVKSADIALDPATKATKYDFSTEFNVEGDFVMEIVNNSPSSSADKNKDRSAIWNITWTSYGASVVTKVATPKFTPTSGEITADTEISISCETEGAQIYYTLDGSDPTTSNTLYAAPFKLSAAATVKAVAVATGLENSTVASADYTFPVANIAEFIAAERKYATSISGTVTVVDQVGSYLFLEDATGRIVAFGSLDNTYNNGDQLTGVKGTYTLYNGLPEMNVVKSSFGTATAGTPVEPVVTTIPNLTLDNLLQYVKIEGVAISGSSKSYTMTDAAGNTATVYNSAGIEMTTGENLNVLGFISCYKTDLQILPVKITTASGMEKVSAPVINPNGGEITANQLIEISCTTEGAQIYYTLDGSDPTASNTLYAAPFTLAADATVKAVAIVTGMENSDIVSAEFTVNADIKVGTFDFTAPETLTPAIPVPELGSSSGASLDGITLTNADVMMSISNGTAGTESRIWAGSSAYDFRAYSGSSFTISVADGYIIKSIEFEGSKAGAPTYWTTTDGVADGKSWAGGEFTYRSVTFNEVKTCNVDAITVTYEEGEATGVENIVVDENAPVVYYNLQGIRVVEPENGIFIRVQGSNVTKVLVRK